MHLKILKRIRNFKNTKYANFFLNINNFFSIPKKFKYRKEEMLNNTQF